jgi:PAS domain S-box-containing protein
VFAVICVVPLVGLSVAEQRLTRDTVDREVRARTQTTADVSAAAVRREMLSLAELVTSYARRPVVVRALRGDSSGGPAELGLMLDELATTRPSIAVSFVTDPTARLIDVRPRTASSLGQSLADQDWYRGVLASDGPYVSEAYGSSAAGSPLLVAAAARVRDDGPGGRGSGRDLGIVVVGYRVQTLVQDARAAAKNVTVTVTDQRGVVVSGPQVEPGRLTSRRNDPVVRDALAGRSGVVRSGDGDDATLRAYSPVADIGWAVVAEIDEDLAFATSQRTRRLTFLIRMLRGLVLLAGIGLLIAVLRARDRVQQRLRRSEERSRAVVEAADEAYVGMDVQGLVTRWNGRAEDTFGWRAAEAIGSRLSELIVPPQHREAHEHGFRVAVETHEGPVLNNRIEITALHKDGHEFPVELSIWPVWDDPEATFNAFLHDITERRQAEADAAVRAELLAAARDAAVEASQLKSAFLANMSHEIRTPMNGVIGMTSLLLDTDLGTRQREYAEGVRASAESLLTVINDILDFSKIEAGKLEIEHVDFRLRAVVEESAVVLAERAASKGIELAVLVTPSVPDVVVGDPGRLRQLLLNLIGNAVKFTDVGEVVVRVATVPPTSSGPDWVRFEVSDTGVGIDPDDLTRLFEPFSQADVSTTRRFGGTGLGLAICTQLVELMGGVIDARSELGRGSVFAFVLPLEPGASGGMETPPQLESLRGKHVVVVDDNATNRTILEEYLHSWGMTSTSYERGDAALAGMRHGRPPDLAVLDYQMPEMDGLELARRISSDPALVGVPMVLLTSAAQRGDAGAAASAGISGYLTKPVRSSQLYNVLATVFTGARPADGRVARPLVTLHTMPPEGGERLRLLLAEDNQVNQTVAVRMLERLGFQVDVVADGAAAVDAVRSGPDVYAGVLMDCQMPGVDGYEATAQIRADEGIGRRTPIIAMTAGAMTGDRERCLAAGMDDYLSKPVRPEELETLLRRWVPIPGVPVPGVRAPDGPLLDGPLLDGAADTGSSDSGAQAVGLDPATLLDQKAIGHLRQLSERTGKPILAEITGMFLADTEARLQALRDAHAEGDLPGVSAAAHYLRGSCGGVGASALGAVCAVLEQAATDGDADAVAAAMPEFDAVAAATIPAIRALT